MIRDKGRPEGYIARARLRFDQKIKGSRVVLALPEGCFSDLKLGVKGGDQSLICFVSNAMVVEQLLSNVDNVDGDRVFSTITLGEAKARVILGCSG